MTDGDTFQVIRVKTEWTKIDGVTYRRTVDTYPDGRKAYTYGVQSGRFSEGTLRDTILEFGQARQMIRRIDEALGVSPN